MRVEQPKGRERDPGEVAEPSSRRWCPASLRMPGGDHREDNTVWKTPRWLFSRHVERGKLWAELCAAIACNMKQPSL